MAAALRVAHCSVGYDWPLNFQHLGTTHKIKGAWDITSLSGWVGSPGGWAGREPQFQGSEKDVSHTPSPPPPKKMPFFKLPGQGRGGCPGGVGSHRGGGLPTLCSHTCGCGGCTHTRRGVGVCLGCGALYRGLALS